MWSCEWKICWKKDPNINDPIEINFFTKAKSIPFKLVGTVDSIKVANFGKESKDGVGHFIVYIVKEYSFLSGT